MPILRSNVIPERIFINCQEWEKGQKIGPKMTIQSKMGDFPLIWGLPGLRQLCRSVGLGGINQTIKIKTSSQGSCPCSGHLQGQNIHDVQALICYSRRSTVLFMKHIEQITANLDERSCRLLKGTEQGCVAGCPSTPGYRRNMLEQRFCSRRGEPMSIL